MCWCPPIRQWFKSAGVASAASAAPIHTHCDKACHWHQKDLTLAPITERCSEDTGWPALEARVADGPSPAAAPHRADAERGVDATGQHSSWSLQKCCPSSSGCSPSHWLLEEHILRRNQSIQQWNGFQFGQSSNDFNEENFKFPHCEINEGLLRKTWKVLPPHYSKCCGSGEEPGVRNSFFLCGSSWEVGEVQCSCRRFWLKTAASFKKSTTPLDFHCNASWHHWQSTAGWIRYERNSQNGRVQLWHPSLL